MDASRLLASYATAGPRYTSYPTAPQFHEGFGEADYRQQIDKSNETGGPLSLYLHLPFCKSACLFCACNRVITRNREKIATYLSYLHREIALKGALFPKERQVRQLHWGGGTPTWIGEEAMVKLIKQLSNHFSLDFSDAVEYSIEVDPRVVTPKMVRLLREVGFNRISFGVQDLNPAVQKAINRVQSEELIFSIFDAARKAAFHSISIDLILGLPHQTEETFHRTLERMIEAGPDRFAIFHYAHLPEKLPLQKKMDEAAMPSSKEKMCMLQHSWRQLEAAGYVHIGMDHFAKADDELAEAQLDGTLYRNFQGYSTHANCDLIGFGTTAISMVQESYAQNVRELSDYYALLEEGRLPVMRGYLLNKDDQMRRWIIMELLCQFILEERAVEERFGIDFSSYFSQELGELEKMATDGLLTRQKGLIKVTTIGRFFIRNICMVFDRYLREGRHFTYSKVL